MAQVGYALSIARNDLTEKPNLNNSFLLLEVQDAPFIHRDHDILSVKLITAIVGS